MGKSKETGVEYILRLFISGATPNSLRAISNIQKIMETHLEGRYSLNIIDVRQETAVAQQEQIIALPLLIINSDMPEKRLIGDLSDTKKVLAGLGIIVNGNE